MAANDAEQPFDKLDIFCEETASCLVRRPELLAADSEAAENTRDCGRMDSPSQGKFPAGPKHSVREFESHAWKTGMTNSWKKLIPSDVPSPLPPLPFTPADIAALRKLRADREAVLSGPTKRRLMVLLALSERKSHSDIASGTGITYQRVLAIRKQVAAQGTEKSIADLREAILRKMISAQPATPARKPGRPATPTLKLFAGKLDPKKESIIELVSVIIAADIQLAILGVQTPRQKAAAPQQSHGVNLQASRMLQALVRASIDRASEPARWTFFPFDKGQSYLFNLLRWRLKDAIRFGANYKESKSARILAESFPLEWSFYVFHSGQNAVIEPLINRIIGTRRAESHSWKWDSFCSKLESLIYQLRVTCNLYGLCPSFQELIKKLSGRHRKQCHFEAHWIPSQVHASLLLKMAQFATLAHAGYLFALNLHLADEITKTERIPLRISMPRQQVSIKEDGSEMRVLRYLVLPELGYDLKTGADVAERLMAALRQKRLAPSFEYSVRLDQGQATTSFPKSLLKWSKGDIEIERAHVALIGLPRQFLTPPPPIPIADLAKLASKRDETNPMTLATEGKHARTLCFSCPTLIDAIKEAFENNEYGDSIAALQGWKKRTASNAGNPGQPPFGWLWDLVVGFPEIAPPFHFSDQELHGKILSPATLKRLNQSPVPELAVTVEGGVLRSDKNRYPGYDRQRMLENIYAELDADFLLRKIRDKTWSSLVTATTTLESLGREIIQAAYFPEKRLEIEKITEAIPRRLRELREKNSAELPSWAYEAYQHFKPFPRVLRRAVECAQRLVLAGLPPAAVAICPEEELLRSWKSYLGLHLTRKLLDTVRKQNETAPESLAETRGRQNTNDEDRGYMG